MYESYDWGETMSIMDIERLFNLKQEEVEAIILEDKTTLEDIEKLSDEDVKKFYGKTMEFDYAIGDEETDARFKLNEYMDAAYTEIKKRDLFDVVDTESRTTGVKIDAYEYFYGIRDNHKPSAQYIDELRANGITPVQQLKDILDVCDSNKDLSERVAKSLKRNKFKAWRGKVKLNIDEVVKHNTWRNTRVSELYLFDFLLDFYSGLPEKMDYSQDKNMTRIVQRGSKRFQKKVEQLENRVVDWEYVHDSVAPMIVNYINEESLEWACQEEAYALLYDDVMDDKLQSNPFNSSAYGERISIESLSDLTDEEADDAMELVCAVEIWTRENVGMELQDMEWCLREIKQFIYRMKHRKIRNIEKAFTSKEA